VREDVLMTEQRLAEIGIRLIDEAHFAWWVAARECENAHRAWLEGMRNSHDAYCAYRAALDREEAAARDLERLSALTRPCRDVLDALWARDEAQTPADVSTRAH
jgi:hypothetical protein